ncbi:MAG: hypothetical protein WA208_07415 [Thermoanaerobaculia bacterium]
MNAVVIFESLRRHFTSILFIALAGSTVVGGMIAAHIEPGSFWTSLVFLVAIVVGAEVLGQEFSTGTLQLILTKPINRSVYAISRVAGAVLTTWIVAAAALMAEIVARLYWVGGRDIDRAAIAALNVSLEIVLVCSMLAFFGSFLRSYFNVAAYFLAQVVLQGLLTVLVVFRNAKSGFIGWLGGLIASNPWVGALLSWISGNLFPDRPARLDPHWMLLVVCNSVLLLIAASLIYRRREVPYGAD